ncbi:hypothetical protein ACIBLA_20710 [Streptomyces sp. NPDC050433]|uniref:hypothetical protein n=1 Tax=Streptomyces sp. NPDC050433 TaxID=3365615 RepID=UPI00379CBF09
MVLILYGTRLVMARRFGYGIERLHHRAIEFMFISRFRFLFLFPFLLLCLFVFARPLLLRQLTAERNRSDPRSTEHQWHRKTRERSDSQEKSRD